LNDIITTNVVEGLFFVVLIQFQVSRDVTDDIWRRR